MKRKPTLSGLAGAFSHIVWAFLGLCFTGMALLLVGYFAFVWYVLAQKVPAQPKADVIVVLTGGPHRIETGLKLLVKNAAPALFVSGVHKETKFNEMLERNISDPALRITLNTFEKNKISIGRSATTTEENAAEVALWLGKNPAPNHRLILVTADSHMPRALLLFNRALPEYSFVAVPVRRHPEGLEGQSMWKDTAIEYTKIILTFLNQKIGRTK